MNRRGPLMVIKSPSKFSSQLSLPESKPMSADASNFNLSEENSPPKLSCGFKCGRCKELGEIEVVKSSSQLSSPVHMLLVGEVH